jgi:hypothetical protein
MNSQHQGLFISSIYAKVRASERILFTAMVPRAEALRREQDHTDLLPQALRCYQYRDILTSWRPLTCVTP